MRVRRDVITVKDLAIRLVFGKLVVGCTRGIRVRNKHVGIEVILVLVIDALLAAIEILCLYGFIALILKSQQPFFN